MLTCPPVTPRPRFLRLVAAAALLAAGLLPGRAPVVRADVPALLLPARRDTSARIESEPAPLIVPGRPNPGAAGKTREQQAREQYEFGLGLEADGAPAAAIAAYRNAVRLDPRLPRAHARMGRLYNAVGQYRYAAAEFAAEIVLDPGNRVVARELGVALAHTGDSTNALRQLELLTARDGRDTASWRALGFAYGLANRPLDAERALRRATALDSRDGRTWRDLGVVLAGLGRADEARTAYRKAAALQPRDGSALVNLGNLEARANHWDAALVAYQEAEQRDSLLEPAYDGQVRALVALGRDAEAGAAYRRWLAALPDAPATRMAAIEHFAGMDRDDIALELAREGVRANPKSSDAHYTLGLQLRATGDVPGALAELRKAAALMPAAQRPRIAALIAGMRARAPDSLRAVFVADSIAFEPAVADSARSR